MSRHKKLNGKHGLKYINSRKSYGLYESVPLFAIVGIVPLIIFLKKIMRSDPGSIYADGLGIYLDLFAFYKMALLVLLVVIGLLVFIHANKNNLPDILTDGNRKAYYIPMGIYVSLVLLSSFASEHKVVAFFGYTSRLEGAIALIAYVLAMFLAMNILHEEKQLKILFYCLFISAFLIAAMGALQYAGVDFSKSEIFNRIVTPAYLWNERGAMKSTFPPNTVFSTLGNPNYVGSYMAMLIPVIIIAFIWVKKPVLKLTLGALLLLAALNWVACESRAGIAGGAIAIIVIVLMLRKKLFRRKAIVIIASLLVCGTLLAVNFATGGAIIRNIVRMATLEGKGDSQENIQAMEKTLSGLNDVLIDGKSAKLVMDGGTLVIMLPGGRFAVTDGSNKELEYSTNGDIVTFADDRFKHVRLELKPGSGLINVYYNDYLLINILFTEDGLKSGSNRWMTYRNNREIEVFGGKWMEALGSNRGYIWSRTIPMLKDTIILGHGPDTYPIYFPQYDYLGKLRLYGTGGIFVDKPHNMYLQMAVNTGLLSLFAVLAIFALYFISCVKIYIKEKFDTFLPLAGLSCFAAFCGYIAAGFFNDSVVATAPVFWVLLGAGIGINLKISGSGEKLVQMKKVPANSGKNRAAK